MHVLDANGEALMFLSRVIRVVLCAEDGDVEKGVSYRVEDTDGADITHLTRDLHITKQFGQPEFATMELMMPGFDGPFCTPAVDWQPSP